MFRRLLLFVTILSLIASPAHAQLVVFDPGNLVQTTLIAYRMQQHYAELRAQYEAVSSASGPAKAGRVARVWARVRRAVSP